MLQVDALRKNADQLFTPAYFSIRGGARKAYEDFFTLWKEADADIPILKQAEAEYAKL